MENKFALNDKTLSWFLALFVIGNITVFSLDFIVLYYLFLGLALIISIYKTKIKTINIPMLLLYIACVLSIILNDLPP